MRCQAWVWLVMAGALVSGCESLTASEKETARDLHHFGIDTEQEYSPGTALGLNVLPGIGNFYLGQIGYGVLNLLTWPVSILWGVPQAWADAKTLNEKYTVDYYKTRDGQERLQHLLTEKRIPDTEWPYWAKK